MDIKVEGWKKKPVAARARVAPTSVREGRGWPEGERGGEGGGNYWKSTKVAAALVEMVVAAVAVVAGGVGDLRETF